MERFTGRWWNGSEWLLALVGVRDHDDPTSGGRVRREPSPGGWWAGVGPVACPDRPEGGLILGAL